MKTEILTTLLTDEEVKKHLRYLAKKRNKSDEKHIKEINDISKQRLAIQQRCPHTKTRIQYGQYMPCETICSLCGMEID